MDRALNELRSLQDEINSRTDTDLPNEFHDSLMFCETGGLIKINFYGDPWGEIDAFNKFLRIIVNMNVSPYIKSIKFSGPDEGANGTKPWDFSIVANSKAVFPNLISFSVESTQPEHHNRSIISGDFYEENGMIAELIRKMPNLLSLSVPSAPNHEFFQINSHPLNLITVQTGYDTQNFILNLSKSSCFPNLRYIDFADYQETYIDNYESRCTPFSHYKELFRSSGFDQLRILVLRNPLCSREEISELKSLRKDIQVMLIKTSSEYV